MKLSLRSTFAALALSATAVPALAAIPAYPAPGTINPTSYTFTATSDTVKAFYTGSSAGNRNTLGLRVNGTDYLSSLINNNPNASAPGDSFIFSGFSAGDVLTFFIAVGGDTATFFSDPSLNADGLNHIYSTPYAGGDTLGSTIIPEGTFVSFEDLSGGGDRDYNDIGFVFTNVVSAAPEPATWAMMIGGFGMAGGALRRRRDRSVPATA